MNKQNSLHRRSHLLSGLAGSSRLPRRPLQTGTGPSLRDPGRSCRFSERIGLTAEELDEIATRINAAGQSGQAVAHTDPVLCVMGAPSVAEMHRLLDQVAADIAGDPPGHRDPHQDDADLFPQAGSDVIDLGTTPWPAAR